MAQIVVCLQCGRPGFDPWVGKIPWRRKWQPTPVFLRGESHGQRSLHWKKHKLESRYQQPQIVRYPVLEFSMLWWPRGALQETQAGHDKALEDLGSGIALGAIPPLSLPTGLITSSGHRDRKSVV